MTDFGGGFQPVHVIVSLLVSTTVISSFLWKIAKSLRRTNAIMEKFMIEHEILIADYCKRNGLRPEDLPTRMKGLKAAP